MEPKTTSHRGPVSYAVIEPLEVRQLMSVYSGISPASAAADAVNVFNNIFHTVAPSPVIIDDNPSASIKFEGNDYRSAGATGNFNIGWAGTTDTSLHITVGAG